MIRRRGGIYWTDFWIGSRRIRKSLKTDEYGLALDRARELERNEKAGCGGRGLRFEDFKRRYLEWAKSSKPSSYRTEEYRVKILIDYFKSQKIDRLDQVTPYHVERLRIWIRLKDRRVKKRKGVQTKETSKSTANRYCALLRTLYNRAIDWELYQGKNPVSKVKLYKETRKLTPLSPDERDKVIAAASTIAEKPQSPVQSIMPDFIEFALNTGLRKSELLNLRWRDMRDDTIEVIGKGERRRIVPLNQAALEVLSRQARGGPFVFDIPNRHQPDVLRRTVVQIRELSKVRHFHFHLCRHSFISDLLAAGADIKTIADIVGHSTVSTTLLYAHSTPERLRRAVESLDKKTLPDTNAGHSPTDMKSPNPA